MQKKKKKQQIAEQPKEFRYSRHTITPAFFNTSNVSVCLGLGFRMVLGGSERVRKRKRMERERARDKKIIHFYFVSEFFLLLLHLILFDRRFWIRSHTIWSQTFANPIQWQFLKQLNSDQYKHNTQFKHTFSITFSELNNNNNSKAISTTHTRTHTQRRQKKCILEKCVFRFVCFEKQRNIAAAGSGRSSSNSSRDNNNNNDNSTPTTEIKKTTSIKKVW